MKAAEKYWSYKAPSIPEVKDLPPGVFRGDEREWSKLSPGMRRTIWRVSVKIRDPETGFYSVPLQSGLKS
jgi:hypothetical protein